MTSTERTIETSISSTNVAECLHDFLHAIRLINPDEDITHIDFGMELIPIKVTFKKREKENAGAQEKLQERV